MGGNADSDAERKCRFENLPKQNRFFEMRAEREALRTRYIKEGVLPDPDTPQDLAAAKTFLGTCLDMCPEFEREEREFQNEGDPLEMFPGSTRLDPVLAVKIYRRPAAGRELPLPEDVRPPEVLRQTLDYLMHDLLPSDPSTSRFTTVQPFMWNRTRAIRQDFIVQGERGPLAIECHERIARYHILCLHWRGGVGADGWSEQQELEQLRKTIRSLTEFYEDLRRTKGQISSNEAEFRAYNLLLHMSDPETLREVETLPSAISDAAPVRAALTLRMYAQRSNNTVRRGRPANTEATLNLWTRFFGELRKAKSDISYLLACLAENAFSQVRAGALKAMSKTYLKQHPPLPLAFLRRNLGMDSDEEVRTFAVALGCEEVPTTDDTGKHTINLRVANANDDVPLPVAPFSNSIVEKKRGTWSAQDVVDGKASGAVPLLPIPRGARSTQAAQATQLSVASTAFKPAPTMAQPKPQQSLQPKATQQLQAAPALSAKAPSFTPIASSSSPAASTPLQTTAMPLAPIQQKSFSAFAMPSTMAKQSDHFRPPIAPHNVPAERAPEKRFAAPAPVVPAVDTPPSFQGFAMPEARKPLHTAQAIQQHEPPLQATSPEARDVSQSEGQIAFPAPLPQQAEQAAPVAISEKRARRRTRTKESVTAAIYSHLLEEYLQQKTLAVAEQACLRESRIRQKQERASFLQDSAAQMTEEMLATLLEDAVASSGCQAIADEAVSRFTQARMLKYWRRRLEGRQEQHRQSARLKAIRHKLGKSDITVPTGHVDHKKHMAALHYDEGAGDPTLESKIREARQHTESLWLPTTFLWATALRIEELAVSSVDAFTIALQTAGATAPSSQWLRSKFSLHDEHIVETETNDEAVIRAIDVSRCTSDELDEEGEVGLVIFELKTPLGGADNLFWAAESARLQDIAQSNLIRRSRYMPALLVVSWYAPRERADDAEMQKKLLLRRLNLSATDKDHLTWNPIEVWRPDQSVSGENPQATYEAHLRSLLTTIEPNRHLQRVTFDEVASVASAPYLSLLERADAGMSRLMIAATEPGKEITDFVKEAFTAMSRLLRRVLEDIASLSTIESEDILAVCSSLDAANTSEYDTDAGFDALLRRSALRQLQQVRQTMRSTNISDSDIALLNTWLAAHSRKSNDGFPWQEYFARLLQSLLTAMREAWLEWLYPTMEDARQELKATATLMQEAANELQWRVRDLITRHSLVIPISGDVNGHAQDAAMEVDEEHRDGPLIPSQFQDNLRPHLQASNSSSAGSLSKKPRRSQDVSHLQKSDVDALQPARTTTRLPAALANLRGLIASSNELLMSE